MPEPDIKCLYFDAANKDTAAVFALIEKPFRSNSLIAIERQTNEIRNIVTH